MVHNGTCHQSHVMENSAAMANKLFCLFEHAIVECIFVTTALCLGYFFVCGFFNILEFMDRLDWLLNPISTISCLNIILSFYCWCFS